MEPLRDDQLIAELRALRPTPRPEFAAELDERAAAGFPRRPRLRVKSPADLWAAMRNKGPADFKRLLLPATGLAVLAIAAVIALSGLQDKTSEGGFLSQTNPAPQNFDGSGAYAGKDRERAAVVPIESAASDGAFSAAGSAEAEMTPFSKEMETRIRHRDVERSASITLGAKPEDVAGDSARVYEVVHANDGIVMRSGSREGGEEAEAHFELLIPSAKLGEAMAAFSGIDSVRSRHEASADITAPTVSTAELLKESRARIDSLLAQLADAETEAEREAVEAELRHERRHASRLAAQLTHLHRRADFSRVSLQIVSGGGEPSAGGAWGVDDALGDAGHILAVAAGVVLVGLAILGPVALIALLAWLTHRAWVRRQRRRVLS